MKDSREVVKALLARKPKEAGRYGVFENQWVETLAKDGWPSQGYPEGVSPVQYFDYDLMGVGGWFDSSPFLGVDEMVEETAEWKVTKNGSGATLKHWKKRTGVPEHIGFECITEEIWRKKYREPLLSVDRARFDFESAREKLALAKAQNRFSVMSNRHLFETMRSVIGDENFLPALLTEPEWIKDFCRVYTDFYINHWKVLFAEVGLPDGMFIYEDLGYRNGPFAGPDLMRELMLPFYKEYFKFFKSYKLPIIMHSCGDIRKLLPIITEAGVDCIQPLEAKAGINVIEVAKEWKDKIAFMGNIDVMILETNDKQKVKEEVETKVKALKKMGASYFYHSDHSVPPSVTLETYNYGLEVFRENSKI